jgi:hypothetical protein
MEKKLPNQTTKGSWYILTNLGSLTVAIQVYKRKMEIEEMGLAELGYDKFIVRAPKNNTSKNAELMQCPECQSTHINKTGQKKGKHNYICVGCGRVFIDCYQPHKGYSWEVKRECLKMSSMVGVFEQLRESKMCIIRQ